MKKLTFETKKLMDERFGHDNIIALATIDAGIPYVRNVDAFYEEGAFYVITYALSNKMNHIAKSCRSDCRRLVYRSWNRNQSWLFRQTCKQRNRQEIEKSLLCMD